MKLVSKLPQDDTSKWAQAQIAKELGLLSDVDIHDNILGTQDSQQAMDKVLAQQAANSLPEAAIYTRMMAAADRGEKVIAQLWFAEYQRLIAEKMGLVPPQPKPGANGAKPKGKGLEPEVMPNAATGAQPQPETSNNGPALVAPGTPRPGARGQP